MFQRCEADHGAGNCEKTGLNVYPKCAPGYSAFGCCTCIPDFESCQAEGYVNVRVGHSCLAQVELGDPTPVFCREGLVQDGLLCYPPCQGGYAGVGPVCWQECDTDQAWCAAGCARSIGDCVFALSDQIISPLVVAANVATLGASVVPAESAGNLIEIANQLYQFSTTAGTVMGWVASILQVTNPDDAPKNAKVVSINTGNVVLDGAVSATLYGAGVIMQRQFAQDFVAQTSPEIAQTLASKLDARDVLLIQRTWADVMFVELAEAEGWNLADIFLSSFGVLDPTGIVNLLAAYAKPICMEIIPFPLCTASQCRNAEMSALAAVRPYETRCQDIEVFVTTQDSCEAEIDAIALDGGSRNPNHDTMFWSLEPPGPFPVDDEPHSVTLYVNDDLEEVIDSCKATITVVDHTPPSIACPVGVSRQNDPGLCGAMVEYEPFTLTDSCHHSSTTLQTTGLPSSSLFPVGSTTNTFEVADSYGNVDSCSFNVGVFDTEPPQISCDALGITTSTDPDSCSFNYVYDPPVGQDNCEATTVLIESPTLDPHFFPLGASTVEYTSTDMEGNSASCSFVVQVEDRQAPFAECIAKGQSGLFTIEGSDNCADAGLKAYVIDSDSGTRFPTSDSGLEFFEIGTTFTYIIGPVKEQAGFGGSPWRLEGLGKAVVVIEDAAGNTSPLAPCAVQSK
jgi:HYR domain